MKRVVMVAGTNSWDPNSETREWNQPGSEFSKYLQSQGVSLVFPDGRSFTWDTNLGGVGFGNDDLKGWNAAGINLYDYCVPPLAPDRRIRGENLVVLAHSHGMQVALFAFAAGLKGSLVSVGGPVRKDMEATVELARPNIQHWLHIHSDRKDWWQLLGALFDGRLGVYRKHPAADANDFMPDGHSAILRDPKYFPLWEERGWLTNLK